MWFDKAWRGRRATRKLATAQALVDIHRTPMKTKAISDLLSLIGPDGFFPNLRTTIDNQETLLESATFAYTCITGNANALSSLQGIVQKEGGEGEADWVRVRDRKHPLNRFLRHPLGPGVQPEMTWSQVERVASMQLDICGNSYWRILDLSGGQRIALEPLHPEKVEIIGEDGVVPANTGGRIAGYRILDDDRKLRIDLPPDEVVHIVEDSPTSLVRGRAPLSVALRPMTIDRVAQERQKNFLKNRIGPGLLLNIDTPLGFVDDDQETATKKKLNDDLQKVEKEGGILLLSGANKLSASPLPTEVQYIETRAMSRDEILAVFGVPGPIAGVFESALAVNFKEARRIWWGNTLFPRLQSILNAFNRQAIQPRLNDSIRIWYSIEGTDIGLDLIAHRVEVADGLVNKLGYPTNVAAAHVGLDIERIPELDQVNARFVTAGRVFDETGTPVADSPAETDAGATEAPPPLAIVPDS